MVDTRFHGARVKENKDLETAINDIDSSVIGIIAVADDADADLFPLDTPVLLTRVRSALGRAGKTGTLYKSLKAISDQCSPRVIVVRVAAAAEDGSGADQDQLIMGGTAEDGSYLGMYTLLTAEQKTGYRPRILAVPGLETSAVISMLCVIAEKLRAFVYSGCGDSKTLSEASMFRDTFPAVS